MCNIYTHIVILIFFFLSNLLPSMPFLWPWNKKLLINHLFFLTLYISKTNQESKKFCWNVSTSMSIVCMNLSTLSLRNISSGFIYFYWTMDFIHKISINLKSRCLLLTSFFLHYISVTRIKSRKKCCWKVSNSMTIVCMNILFITESQALFIFTEPLAVS